MDIICLGELLMDMAPAELGRRLVDVSSFSPKPGGAPANVAVAAARMGLQSAFIGKVGDDPFGHFLAEVLAQDHVNISGVRYDNQAKTSMAFFAKPNAHTAEYLFYRNPGADMLLRPDELDAAMLQSTRVLHFGSITLIQEPSRSATETAIQQAHSAGAMISFDVNYRPSLWSGADEARERMRSMVPQADLLKVNEEELSLLTGSDDLDTATAHLLSLGPRLVVVTMGPGGSYFRCAVGGEFVPSFVVDAIDPVGCGDAFVGGLIAGLLSSADWSEQITIERLRAHVRFANAVGALTATKAGAIPALPRHAEVEAFLQYAVEVPKS
jgi:fructokinase